MNKLHDHFVVLMYLVTQFAWPAVQEFHAAVLFEIECGRAHWGDSFAHLESRLLRTTGKPVSNPSPFHRCCINRTGIAGLRVLWCAPS